MLQFPHFLGVYIFAIQKMKKRGISLHICVWWFFANLRALCTTHTSIQKVTLIKHILACLHLLYTITEKKKDYEQYLVSKEYFQLNKLLFKVFPGLFIFKICFTKRQSLITYIYGFTLCLYLLKWITFSLRQHNGQRIQHMFGIIME